MNRETADAITRQINENTNHHAEVLRDWPRFGESLPDRYYIAVHLSDGQSALTIEDYVLHAARVLHEAGVSLGNEDVGSPERGS